MHHQSKPRAGKPFAPRRLERVLLTGTRLAEGIMASGLCVPHQQAAHMAAPTEGQNIKKTLANGERPHMAQRWGNRPCSLRIAGIKVLRFRLMVKRGPQLRPQASEGEAQHGLFLRD